MSTILDDIIAQKKVELETLSSESVFYERKPVSFVQRLKSAESMAVISEVKRKSPSKGDINQTVDPSEQAAEYASGGADAVSVLTDQEFFSGSMEDLKNVKAGVEVPVLNKDFIIDEKQINNAYLNGADIILLIVAALSDEALKGLHRHARSLNLDVLVEVHNEEEMKRALEIQPEFIGVNNRDLKTFTVDISNTEYLLGKYAQAGPVFIAESGIKTGEDSERMKEAGAKALLIGETLMMADDPGEKIKELKVVL